MIDFATAAGRFGLGTRPDDARVADVRRALLGQFERFEVRPAALASAPTRATVAGGLADYLEQTRAYRQQVGSKADRTTEMAMGANGAPSGETVQEALKASRKYAGQVARSHKSTLQVTIKMKQAILTPRTRPLRKTS